jgi:alanyl-tRNA synthetase
MYDTYGFPIDLVMLMAEEKNMTVDKDGLDAAREEAKLISQGDGMLPTVQSYYLPYGVIDHLTLLSVRIMCSWSSVCAVSGSKKGEAVTLDVHALAELRDKGVSVTDDSPKYDYTKAHGSHYGML